MGGAQGRMFGCFHGNVSGILGQLVGPRVRMLVRVPFGFSLV